MELLKIKPSDNTFFGTGQQFNYDNNNFIESKIIPYPSVFFGAIFTALLTKNPEFREKFFKENKCDHETIMNIGNIYLFNERTNEAYIKAPKDIFVNSKGNIKFGKFTELKQNTSLKFSNILMVPGDKEYKRADNKFINIRNIYDSYEKKQGIRIDLESEEDIFVKSMKLGIGVNSATKTTEEGMLYRREETEFRNNEWAFVVEYHINEEYFEKKYKNIKLNPLERGYLKLGGESKTAKFEKIQNKHIKDFTEKNYDLQENNKFKIIFTADSFFKKNIRDTFKDKFNILGISNDKPIYIGGIDLKNEDGKKAIREMYKGYSAGTVILVEYISYGNIADDLHNIMKENASKGFNQYVIVKDR